MLTAFAGVRLGGGYLALCAAWFVSLDRWSGPVVAVAVPVAVTATILAFLAYARRRASPA